MSSKYVHVLMTLGFREAGRGRKSKYVWVGPLQTYTGHISAVSTPIEARNGLFSSMFLLLQNVHVRTSPYSTCLQRKRLVTFHNNESDVSNAYENSNSVEHRNIWSDLVKFCEIVGFIRSKEVCVVLTMS